MCLEDGRIADAAIYLEQELVGSLPTADKKEVHSLLDSYGEYVSFSIATATTIKDQLRAALAEKSEIYRKIKSFFQSPNGSENAAVLAAYKEVATTGITGAVNGSNPAWA